MEPPLYLTSIKSWIVYPTTLIIPSKKNLKKKLDYIIFDILNQFNLVCFWPITPCPKLGLAIINFKQKLTILSSFPLILNHCSISIGKNQLIPHIIANNHKNARTNGRIDWSQSMQRDPYNGKLACFDRVMMTQWKIQKSSREQYFFDSNRILTWSLYELSS